MLKNPLGGTSAATLAPVGLAAEAAEETPTHVGDQLDKSRMFNININLVSRDVGRRPEQIILPGVTVAARREEEAMGSVSKSQTIQMAVLLVEAMGMLQGTVQTQGTGLIMRSKCSSLHLTILGGPLWLFLTQSLLHTLMKFAILLIIVFLLNILLMEHLLVTCLLSTQLLTLLLILTAWKVFCSQLLAQVLRLFLQMMTHIPILPMRICLMMISLIFLMGIYLI
jgi:hypothetical protein